MSTWIRLSSHDDLVKYGIGIKEILLRFIRDKEVYVIPEDIKSVPSFTRIPIAKYRVNSSRFVYVKLELDYFRDSYEQLSIAPLLSTLTIKPLSSVLYLTSSSLSTIYETKIANFTTTEYLEYLDRVNLRLGYL